MPFVIPTPPPAGPAGSQSTAPLIPHFAWPWRFSTTTGVTVVEQDSLDEIYSCVRMIADCPQGAFSPNLPLGIPSPEFAQAPLDTTAIERGIVRSEPRAVISSSESASVISDAIRNVQIAVSSQQADQ